MKFGCKYWNEKICMNAMVYIPASECDIHPLSKKWATLAFMSGSEESDQWKMANTCAQFCKQVTGNSKYQKCHNFEYWNLKILNRQTS